MAVLPYGYVTLWLITHRDRCHIVLVSGAIMRKQATPEVCHFFLVRPTIPGQFCP